MEKAVLISINNQIYHQFPEVNGSQPKVQAIENGNTLIIYKGKGVSTNGKIIPRIIRVVAGPTGKIIKTTTSR